MPPCVRSCSPNLLYIASGAADKTPTTFPAPTVTMKLKPVLLLASTLAIAAYSHASVVLSNLGTSVPSYSVISSNQFLAQSFQVGNGAPGYRLDFVEIRFAQAELDTMELSLSIYDNNAGIPGIEIGQLIPDAPLGRGDNHFTPNGLLNLNAGDTYWIVATASGGSDEFDILESAAWSGDLNLPATSMDNWAFGNAMYYISSSSEWALDTNWRNQMAIGATAVPEPSTYAVLAGAAALGLAVWRRRRS